MADDKDSDSSGFSSAGEEEIQKLAPIFVNAKKANKQRYPPPHLSPPRPKRPPSPPREEQFADNPDIAVSRQPRHFSRERRVRDALYASGMALEGIQCRLEPEGECRADISGINLVPRHVPLTIQRGYAVQAEPNGASRHRERGDRSTAESSSRESSMRLARAGAESQETG